jgi:hypothetical protein
MRFWGGTITPPTGGWSVTPFVYPVGYSPHHYAVITSDEGGNTTGPHYVTAS